MDFGGHHHDNKNYEISAPSHALLTSLRDGIVGCATRTGAYSPKQSGSLLLHYCDAACSCIDTLEHVARMVLPIVTW